MNEHARDCLRRAQFNLDAANGCLSMWRQRFILTDTAFAAWLLAAALFGAFCYSQGVYIGIAEYAAQQEVYP